MFRFGAINTGSQRQVVIDFEGHAYALSSILPEQTADNIEALFSNWDQITSDVENVLKAGSLPSIISLDDVTFEAPVTNPRNVICIGINYHDHIDEMGVNAPKYPYAFLRPSRCVTGHKHSVKMPDWPSMIDWEAELGVVIGKKSRNLTKQNALQAVAGYTVVNDVSARDWIEDAPFVGIDWVMQKAWDDFQPTGPWLVPAKFIKDPQALDMELTVNGVVKQQQSTSQMVFSVTEILVHLSTIMTLEPGDIIATGTPAGVGFGRKPREFLKKGDEVSVSISHLGTLTNSFV